MCHIRQAMGFAPSTPVQRHGGAAPRSVPTVNAAGPFDQSRVDVVWEASLHWSCPAGYYGQGARGALLHLPRHPDTVSVATSTLTVTP